MKQQMKPHRGSHAILGVCLTVLLSFYPGLKLRAQIVDAVNLDFTADIHDNVFNSPFCSPDVSSKTASTLNCDMMDDPSGGKLYVIAYSVLNNAVKTYNPSWGCSSAPDQDITGLHIEFTGSTNIPGSDRNRIFLGSIGKPDVAIGNHSAGSGNYIITTVYTNPSDEIELITCDALNVGSGSPSVSGVSSPVTLSTPGRIARDAHIDLFGDDGGFVGSIHSLHKFIAVWEEEDGFGVHYIMAAIGDISNPSSFTLHQITPNTGGDPEGISPDVAAMGMVAPCGGCDINTAFITYLDPAKSNALMHTQIGLDGSDNITSTKHTTLSTGTVIGVPRIESKALGDFINSEVTWRMVYSSEISPGNYFLGSFSDQATGVLVPLPYAQKVLSPCLTGVGEDMDPTNSGRIGETEFITGYYFTYTNNSTATNGDFYVKESPIVSTNWTINVFNSREVNMDDLEQTGTYSSPYDVPMAISTSSNTGDGMLAVWYGGYTGTQGLIQYKIVDNTYNFKPTDINKVNSNLGLSIQPNPVQNELHVMLNKNISANAMLSITDVSGKLLKQIPVKAAETIIDVSSLTPGMYMLRYSDATHNKTMRMIKE